MRYDRMRRVNEMIRRELALLCEREVVHQVDALPTITDVKTAPDLRQAQVFVSVLGDEKQQEQVLRILNRQRVDFQSKIGHALQLKYTPVLHFRIDHTPAEADHILSIIDELDLSDVPDAGELPPDEEQ